MTGIEKLHNQVWTRFIRMPYGHLLDNADSEGNTFLPRKSDCEQLIPNCLGWLTGVENGGFFGGLYLYALTIDYDRHPSEERKKDILIIAKGLFHLCDLSATDGFIVRGVADDGVSHYPVSSEDQVGPWLLGMWRLYHSTLPDERLKEEIAHRIRRTVVGVYRGGYCIPTEWENDFRGGYAGKDWRGVCKCLFCGRLMDEFASDITEGKEYLRLRDTAPCDSVYTRLEIASHGFAPDMVENRHLVQFWIDLCAHMCIKELSALDIEGKAYYEQGLRSNGTVAVQFSQKYLKYPNPEKLCTPPDWRKLTVKTDFATRDQALNWAWGQFDEWFKVFPSYHEEHDIVCDVLSADWIAITSGEPKTKAFALQELNRAVEYLRWETMWYSYAFLAESALLTAE